MSSAEVVTAMLVLAVAAGLGFAVGPLGALAPLAIGVVIVFVAAASRYQRIPTAAAIEPAAPVREEAPLRIAEIMPWIALAIVVRIVAVIGLNGTFMWGDVAPDAVYYQLSGEAILAEWQYDPTAGDELKKWLGSEERRPIYSIFNAISMFIFGNARFPMSFLNTFVGIGVAWAFALLAQRIYGRAAAKRVLLLGLFFPSVVLWSSMNIREVWSYLIIGLVLLAAQHLRFRFSVLYAGVLLTGIWLMFLVRPYLVPVLLLGVGASYVVVKARQLPYALVALTVLVVFAQLLGPAIGFSTDLFSTESLETIHQMRINLAFGGSAYGAEADTRTWLGSLLYLPEGIVRFLLSPFPWSITSWRQLITLPETLIWYPLLFQALRGMWHDARHQLQKVATLLFVFMGTVGAYALVSGNEGTAYRHRAQIMFIAFIFAAGHHARRASQRHGRSADATSVAEAPQPQAG